MANEKIKTKEMDKLFDAILHLETIEDCYAFFTDLCSIPELISFEQRFQVAHMLHDNVTYQSIAAETTASTATISRVNKCLHYGEGGYMKAIVNQKKRNEQKN